MAIRAREEKKADGSIQIIIEIDNGDREAFSDVMEQYRFVDEQALLRYALISFLNSTDNKLYVKKDGNILSVKIAESLIKPNPSIETGDAVR